jgi:hypothetical protein
MSNTVVIYSPQASSRLRYVLDWVFNTRLGIGYTLTHQPQGIIHLSYGISFNNCISIPDAGLLWQKSIAQHDVATGDWNGIPTLYASLDSDVPFDIFSAIFFLITRYEEYYPHTSDKHGRYLYTDSILAKNNWLERPLIDEWIEALRKILIEKYGLSIPVKSFTYLPTYDIDIAWSYKHKGFVRNLGGFLKDLVGLRLTDALKRVLVNLFNSQDPYDAFPFMYSLHNRFGHKPLFFVLAALKTGAYDKNISPNHKAMQRLIRGFAEQGGVGIHPSYYSGQVNNVFKEEKAALENITGSAIKISRQHYIRLFLPQTYRQLITDGITDDYSMGYGTHIGFRAGTGTSFYWYDVENEKQSSLQVHPFCFMDSTARFDMQLSGEDAFERLKEMEQHLRAANSSMITVFHNFSLGTDSSWKEWPEKYAQYLERIARR